MRKRVGRPDKLTDAVRERLLKALRIGNYRHAAARFAGISARTLVEWMRLGKKQHQGRWRDLYREVRLAEAEAEVAMVGRLIEHTKKDPRSVQFYLERKHSKDWGKKDRLAIGGDEGAPPVQIEYRDARLEKLTDEQLTKLDEILKAAQDEDTDER